MQIKIALLLIAVMGLNTTSAPAQNLSRESELKPDHEKISLHIFVDRASVDIYGGDGTLYMPMAKALSPDNQNLELICQGRQRRSYFVESV